MLFPSNPLTPTFRDPAHVFGWLQGKDVEAEAKNTVLLHLLSKARGKGDGGALAVELLLLALWPGLCAIRHRLRPLCSTYTLDADLVGGLTACILGANPDRITRVAATLLRNVERDLRRQYVREMCTARTRADVDDVTYLLIAPASDRPEKLVRALRVALGSDGCLLAAVHIAGFSQKEAASLLGISHDAARKRCQRALSVLKQNYGS